MNSKPLVLIGLLALGLEVGCSCDGTAESGGGDAQGGAGQGANAQGGQGPGGALTGGGGSTGSFGTGGGNECQNLECQQVDCEGEATTTLRGVVYEPKGTIPLYNVQVYVPNGALSPLPEGASCDQCEATLTGDPLVHAVTDATGSFVLENVPVGSDIPLVIQVGKWRRQFSVPTVTACTDNVLEDKTIRLPRNQAEGNLPRIALTTGGADSLECLLPKIGIDMSEFTAPSGTGRVNLFRGADGSGRFAGGDDFPPATELWATVESLQPYDVVLLSCEGGQHTEDKPPSARQAMADYTSLGGRVFASHWHNVWIAEGPAPLSTVATFEFLEDLQDPYTADVNMSFPKGEAFAEWLLNVAASTELGKLVLREAQHTVTGVNPATSTVWIDGDTPLAGPTIQYFTFNTPVGVPEEEQCGRMVLSDIHVSNGDDAGVDFPNGCQTEELSPQEKALLFMLFDLSACLIPDDQDPTDPPE